MCQFWHMQDGTIFGPDVLRTSPEVALAVSKHSWPLLTLTFSFFIAFDPFRDNLEAEILFALIFGQLEGI